MIKKCVGILIKTKCVAEDEKYILIFFIDIINLPQQIRYTQACTLKDFARYKQNIYMTKIVFMGKM